MQEIKIQWILTAIVTVAIVKKTFSDLNFIGVIIHSRKKCFINLYLRMLLERYYF